MRRADYNPSGDPYDAVREEIHAFSHDGVEVLFRRVPIHRQPLESGYPNRRYGRDKVELGSPGEQRRYEVLVGGEHVGWALRSHGSGRQPYRPHALFGGYQQGFGRHGNASLDGDRGGSREDQSLELSDLAPRFVEWRREGVALTWDELVEAHRVQVEREVADKAKQKADRIADDRKRRRELLEREQLRLDTIGALREIAEKIVDDTSNYHSGAIQRAIEQFEGDGIKWHEQEFLDRMARNDEGPTAID